MKTIRIAAIDAEEIINELNWMEEERGEIAVEVMAKVEAALADLGEVDDEDEEIAVTVEVTDDEAVVLRAAMEAAGV